MERFDALLLCGLMAVAAASAGYAVTPTWGDVATLSPSAVLGAGRLCYTDGRDIACDATAPYLTSSGNVGIGTTSPSQKLHIYGVTGKHAQARMERSDNTKQATIALIPGGALSSSNVQWNAGLHANTNSFQIASYDGSSTAYPVTILNGGNVGIGTTSPNANLEVSGTISATNLVVNGVAVTGGGGDRIVSGSVSAIAQQVANAVQVSGSMNVSGTVKASRALVAGDDACTDDNFGAARVNPVTGRFQLCLNRY